MSSSDAEKPTDEPIDPQVDPPAESQASADAPTVLGVPSSPDDVKQPVADVSLEQLSDAFQQMLDPESIGADASAAEGGEAGESGEVADGEDIEPTEEDTSDDSCPISPHSILEAMLFVGDPNNEPLAPDRVAQLIRGVEAEEVDELVRELNAEYETTGRPYEIRTETTGFRLALREEFRRVGDRFYGRVREARLSQAAVEVLALVAYNQPMTSLRVNELRGHPSGPILSQLVRRELLKMERPDEKPRTPVYHTTARFLQLFGLSKLEELPQAEELDR